MKDALAIERIEGAGGKVYSATEDLSSGLVRTIMLAIAEDERDRQRGRRGRGLRP